MPKIEQYSLVQQYQSSYLVNRSFNEECIRLNHNVHVSTQVYDCTQHPHSHTSTPIPPMYSTLPTNGNMTSLCHHLTVSTLLCLIKQVIN